MPGRAKTRLAASLGESAAAEFHSQCVHVLWDRILGRRGIRPFLYCDGRWADFQRLAGTGRFRRQRGADLGSRMRSCLAEMLACGHRKALIIGSDAPTLPDEQLDEALRALENADAVLGPSMDGGFTLIGATRTAPEMFRGVAWSRSRTREDCLNAMRTAGLRTVETPTAAYDVDLPEDLERLRRDPGLQPRLRRWLSARTGDPS